MFYQVQKYHLMKDFTELETTRIELYTQSPERKKTKKLKVAWCFFFTFFLQFPPLKKGYSFFFTLVGMGFLHLVFFLKRFSLV